MISFLFGRSASPPAEDVLDDLRHTLDWMTTDRRLRYSVAQVKTTYAYRAFVKLGGVWP